MPKPNHSIVSEEERIRYVDRTNCLTIWYDEKKAILAFELIFGLAVDEWAFRYHRSGYQGIARSMMVIPELEEHKNKF